MPRTITYITHARSAEELRLEVLSDLNRRLDQLDSYLKVMKPNAAEASRVARARMELLSMQDFWQNVHIAES